MDIGKADHLTSFKIGDESRAVSFQEVMQVKAGVVCDVYSFVDDQSQDLAIVRVAKGQKTPLQKVLSGDKTIEGFLEGIGTLTVRSGNGAVRTYDFSNANAGKPVEIKVGEIMQWAARTNSGLVFYEICSPPYQDGRYKNLPEGTDES